MRRWLIVQIPVALLVLAIGFGGGFVLAQGPASTPTKIPTATLLPSATTTPTLSHTSTATLTRTATLTATNTTTSTPTATASSTPTFGPSLTHTLTPTYDPPDARVLVQANCRYGPGAAYLYEWGLFPGVRVEIFGRNDLGTWIYVHPWTYFDRCWVKTDLVDIFRGDLEDVPPYYSRLPFGELYQPPKNVRASREGDQVFIAWDFVWMTVDDDRGYLIEAWLCKDRQLIFTPVRTDELQMILIDEAGCLQPSGGRLYTAEKHGYTQWVKIPWPLHPGATTTPESD